MNFTPIDDYLLVKPDEVEVVTASGIVLPSQAQTAPNTGTVVAAGPGQYQAGILVPMPVAEGDRVFFYQGHGIPHEIDGVEYFILRTSSLVAKL